MKKYLQVVKNTWDEGLTYRVSFVIYRARSVLQLLTIFFLWQFIVPKGASFAGYSQAMLMTYILGSSFVDSFVMSSRAQIIAVDINEGNLSNYLLRPMNYFTFCFSRDIADKALNVMFSCIEIPLFLLIFNPALFIQTNINFLLESFLLMILGLILYFYFSVCISLLGFWSNETWGPRFIFYQLLTFLAGGLFPLDILPKSIFSLFTFLPFPYLLYFPLKVYLGQTNLATTMQGILITVFWILGMHIIVIKIWQKGLRVYTAQGR